MKRSVYDKQFKMAARLGNSYAQYQLAKIYVADETADSAKIQDAIVCLTKAAEGENQFAQYSLGKLYLIGKNIAKDKETALKWFELSAAQGNIYARFFIEHMNVCKEPSIMLATTRQLHHLSNVFQDNALPTASSHGIQIDRKQRRKTQEKKKAQVKNSMFSRHQLICYLLFHYT